MSTTEHERSHPQRIEEALERAFETLAVPVSPPTLVQAMRWAVFPAGGRVRPRLAIAVAEACGNRSPELVEAAAVALELLHCASLVHDDLPAFDNADLRRGRPTVHRKFGEPIAILAGDGLIMLAFEWLALAPSRHPGARADVLRRIAQGVGAVRGIVAGQAWESEPSVDLRTYHRAKTGALFEAAVTVGAVAGGGDPEAWIPVGRALGEAYQVADDIGDVHAGDDELGKPTGQDHLKGRPNVALDHGVARAVVRLEGLLREAVTAVPPCPTRPAVQRLLAGAATRLLPRELDTPLHDELRALAQE